MEKNTLWAIALLGVFLYLSSSSSTVIIQQPSGSADIGSLVNADVSFTGLNKYVSGTSLTGELVRVFRLNGGRTDLGTTSLNSGGLNVNPGTNYKFYFFMNSTGPDTDYYVDAQDYTGKAQEATDNVVGNGCSIDTNPVVVVRNTAGQTQTASTNAQALSASGSNADIEVDIKSHSDKCYGTPSAPKGNAICFNYNSNAISDIKSNTNFIAVPRSVSGLGLSNALKCFEFGKLEDIGKDTLTIQLQPGSTEPTISHNISIFTDDIGFDLNQNTLAEIWDFTDEDGNQLNRVINATPDAIIYIS